MVFYFGLYSLLILQKESCKAQIGYEVLVEISNEKCCLISLEVINCPLLLGYDTSGLHIPPSFRYAKMHVNYF